MLRSWFDELLGLDDQHDAAASDALEPDVEFPDFDGLSDPDTDSLDEEVASGAPCEDRLQDSAGSAQDLNAATPAQERKGDSGRGEGCVICMERPSDYAVVPCGHRCLCQLCSRRLTRCPVCRTFVLQILKIFDCSAR